MTLEQLYNAVYRFKCEAELQGFKAEELTVKAIGFPARCEKPAMDIFDNQAYLDFPQ